MRRRPRRSRSLPTPWSSAARWSRNWRTARPPTLSVVPQRRSWRRSARHWMPRQAPMQRDTDKPVTPVAPAEAASMIDTGEVVDMSWLQKLMPSRIRTEGTSKGKVPEGLWEKCDGCAAVLYRPELERNLEVCPKCGHHHAIGARKRLAAFFDDGSAEELFADLEPVDTLKFRDSKKYKDRIVAAQKQTGEKDSMIAM